MLGSSIIIRFPFCVLVLLLALPVVAQDRAPKEIQPQESAKKSARTKNQLVEELRREKLTESQRKHLDRTEIRQPNAAPANSRPEVRRPANSQPSSKPKTEIDVQLRDDGGPVLVMDTIGGYRMRLPDGFEPTPMLQIFADGRVLTGRKSNLVKEVEGHMDLVELKSLLVFIGDDCRFFDITSDSLQSDLDDNRVARIMDAPTTRFQVHLKSHDNEVQVYALPHVAGTYSDVDSVASMVAMASRCRRIIASIRLGSDDESDAALAAINNSLAEKDPDAPEYSLDNLQSAEQFVDGRRTATFVQTYRNMDKTMIAYATFQVSAEGKESENVSIVETKPR